MFEKGSRRWLVAVALSAGAVGCGSSGDPIPEQNGPEHVLPDSGIVESLGPWSVHIEVVGVSAWTGVRHVLVSNPDGTPWELTETDESGKLDVEVPHLASVSVLSDDYFDAPAVGEPLLRRIDAVARVSEETTLRVPAYEQVLVGHAFIGPITFVPVGPLPAGTAKIRIELPCLVAVEGSQDPTAPIEMEGTSSCLGATEWYAVALALDVDGKALAASVLEHLPVAAGPETHEVSFANPKVLVDLTAEIQPMDPPLSALSLKLLATAPGNYGVDSAIETTIQVTSPFSPPPTLQIVTNFFSQLSISAEVGFSTIAGDFSHKIRRVQRTSTVPSSFTVDPHALALPVSLSTSPLTETTQPKVEWTLDPDGTVGNCISAAVLFVKNGKGIVWNARQAAETSGGIQLPNIPAVLSTHAVTPEHATITYLLNIASDVDCADFVTLPADEYQAVAQEL